MTIAPAPWRAPSTLVRDWRGSATITELAIEDALVIGGDDYQEPGRALRIMQAITGRDPDTLLEQVDILLDLGDAVHEAQCHYRHKAHLAIDQYADALREFACGPTFEQEADRTIAMVNREIRDELALLRDVRKAR